MKPDLESAIEGLKTRFKPGVVAKKATYYLSLGDAPQEKWTVVLTPTACEVRAGKTENADCVLKTSAELFVKLVNGTWKPGAADFLTGKVKTSDIEHLQRLQRAFGL